MTTTTVNISFGLFALEINQDSALECTDLNTFADVDALRTGNVTRKPYITYEPDYWLLSGAFKSKPDTNPRVGLYSLSQSDGVGAFAVPPVLTISFSEVHSTEGLTIRFSQVSEDYADDIDVAFYDVSDVLIQTDNYNPTSWEFTTGQAITDFKKIIITFSSTNNPTRYLRVTGIDYGTLIHITDADIRTANCVEQTHPLSMELPINTFETTLFSEEADFNIVNPQGDFESLQNRQPLDVYSSVNGVQVYMGQYLLDEWDNPSELEVQFKCFDLLGVLDGLTFMGGMWIDSGPYSTITAGDLISLLLDPIGIPYELDASLESTIVQGWLPISTHREALQQITFAIGAYVTTARSSVVMIHPTVIASDVSTPNFRIIRSEIGIQQEIILKKRVTGVELVSHDFEIATTFSTIELFNSFLEVGEYTIPFPQPINAFTETGNAIGGVVQLSPNHALVEITFAGVYILNGTVGFTDMEILHEVQTDEDIRSSKPNVLNINSATLVSASVGEALVQTIFDYYQQRYRQDIKVFASEIEVGHSVRIDTLFEQTIMGVAERMDIDLAGGFISKAEITGVVE